MYINKICNVTKLAIVLKSEERVAVNSLLDLATDLAQTKNIDVEIALYDLMVGLADEGRFEFNKR